MLSFNFCYPQVLKTLKNLFLSVKFFDLITNFLVFTILNGLLFENSNVKGKERMLKTKYSNYNKTILKKTVFY